MRGNRNFFRTEEIGRRLCRTTTVCVTVLAEDFTLPLVPRNLLKPIHTVSQMPDLFGLLVLVYLGDCESCFELFRAK